jgi:hypothetical protein
MNAESRAQVVGGSKQEALRSQTPQEIRTLTPIIAITPSPLLARPPPYFFKEQERWELSPRPVIHFCINTFCAFRCSEL